MEQRIIFEAVPVKELPPENKAHNCSENYIVLINEYKAENAFFDFINKCWFNTSGYPIKTPTHWLRPVSLSDLIKEEAGNAWDAAEKRLKHIYDMGRPENLPMDKEEYINTITL